MSLEKIKLEIENMDKIQQLEILKIIHQCEPATINENKSGVYMNLSTMKPSTLEKIQKFNEYVQTQEQTLNVAEKQKDEFKHSYFDNNIKQDKEDNLSLYSYQG